MESRRDMAGIWPGRTWVGAVVSLFLGLWLTACGGGGGGGHGADRKADGPLVVISGQVALEDQSMDGATISLSRIDVARTPVTENVKGKQILVELPEGKPVVGPQGDVQFQVRAGALQDDQLYSVTVTCQPVSEHCAMQMPLHVVLSGARLQQGRWNLNVPTEVAYQRLAYYVAARFSEADLKQEMNITAKLLLKADVDGSGGIDYEDLVRWEPADAGSTLVRTEEIKKFDGFLRSGEGVSALFKSIEKLTDPMLGHADLPSRGYKIAMSGSAGFLMSRSSGLQIVDFSDPQEPKLAGFILEGQEIKDFFLQNQYLYIASEQSFYATSEHNFYVFDINDPFQPEMVYGGSLLSEEPVIQVQVVGDFAYLCSWSSGVRIVDVRNSAAPILLEDKLGDSCDEFVVDGQYAYVSKIFSNDDMSELPSYLVQVYNLAKPSKSVVGGFYGVGYFHGLKVDGGYAYFVEGVGNQITPMMAKDRLTILDVSDPSAIAVVGRLDDLLYQGGFEEIVVGKQLLFVLVGDAVCVVDIKKPAQPSYTACADADRGRFGYGINSVSVSGDYAYLSGDGGVDVINVASISAPAFSSYYLQETLTGGVFSGDTLFYVDYDGFLQSVDFSVPLEPVEWRGPFVTSWFGGLWRVLDCLYYVPYRIEDGTQNKAMSLRGSSADSEFSPVNMPINYVFDSDSSGYIVFAATARGFQIVDYSDPFAPKMLFEDSSLQSVNIEYRDSKAYVKTIDSLIVFDVADPSAPQLIGSVKIAPLLNSSGALELHGRYAYLALGDSGLVMVDVGDPKKPFVVGNLFENEWVGAVKVFGHYVYVAKGDRIVNILDLSDAQRPKMFGSIRTLGRVSGFSISQKHLYVGSGFGIEILPLLPPN